jgi:alpha-tubulin suppressor-like RCC1 family protein
MVKIPMKRLNHFKIILPKQINFTNSKIKSACATHSIILTEDNLVYSVGSNSKGQLALNYTFDVISKPKLLNLEPDFNKMLQNGKVTDVICPKYNSFFLFENKEIYCVGLNLFGNCGSQFAGEEFFETVKTELPKLNILKMVCGGYFCIILFQNGIIFGWG